MLVCARCGASNQTPGKFCATCGAPIAAPAGPPGWAPPPAQPPYGPPPGAAPPAYAPPGPTPNYGPPAAPPAQPGWGPPPGQGSSPGAYGPPAWNTPAPQYPGGGGGYEQAHRVGSPDGLNPFGATMSPDHGAAPPAAMPPPYAPAPVPQAQPLEPPPAWPHQPSAPPPEPQLPDLPPPGPGDTRVSMAPEAKPAARDPEHLNPDAPRTLAGFLVNYGEDGDLGRFWPLYQGRTLIGRKDAAPGLDIEIDHATTSSRHAVIYASARPARMKIEDPGSTNGTFVNEERLNFGSKHELSDGDTIRFGGFTVIVKIV